MFKKTSRLVIVAILALGVLVLGIGFWNQAGAYESKDKKACEHAVKSGCKPGQDHVCTGDCLKVTKMCAKKKAKDIAIMKKVVTDIPFHESTKLVLEGKYVCGKCELEKFDACKAMFETNDGELYPLVHNHVVRSMRKTAAADGFKITTRVKRIDGIKYLEVKRFEQL